MIQRDGKHNKAINLGSSYMCLWVEKKKEIGIMGDVDCKVLDHMKLSFESQTLWHHDYQDAWVNHIKVADKNPINILTEMVSITAPRMLGKQPRITI